MEAALKESKEDRVHIMEMAKARVRFAIPPKRKNVVPNHFRQDSADAEPWGSIMRFENFLKARHKHRGNHAKLRPLRSSRWKATYPGLVPVSHRWHEKEHVTLPRELSEDPSGKRARTSEAPLSVVVHSCRLIFRRAVISRDGLEAGMRSLERARAARSR